MAVISKTVLIGMADRAASQFDLIRIAFATINDVGGGLFYTRSNDTNDSDVGLPLGQPLDNIDKGWDIVTNINSGTPLHELITAMEKHFTKVGETTWDAFLLANDERVSDYFNQIYFSIKEQYLKADNVFSEKDDLLGSGDVSSGPTLDFTDGINYGDGNANNFADGSNFAASQLRIKVVGGAIGGTDLDIDVVGKNEDGDSRTVSVVIPASTAENAFIDVGTSANRFRDITNIIYTPSADPGTVGDSFEVRNKKERNIAL